MKQNLRNPFYLHNQHMYKIICCWISYYLIKIAYTIKRDWDNKELPNYQSISISVAIKPVHLYTMSSATFLVGNSKRH